MLWFWYAIINLLLVCDILPVVCHTETKVKLCEGCNRIKWLNVSLPQLGYKYFLKLPDNLHRSLAYRRLCRPLIEFCENDVNTMYKDGYTSHAKASIYVIHRNKIHFGRTYLGPRSSINKWLSGVFESIFNWYVGLLTLVSGLFPQPPAYKTSSGHKALTAFSIRTLRREREVTTMVLSTGAGTGRKGEPDSRIGSDSDEHSCPMPHPRSAHMLLPTPTPPAWALFPWPQNGWWTTPASGLPSTATPTRTVTWSNSPDVENATFQNLRGQIHTQHLKPWTMDKTMKVFYRFTER